MEVLQGYSQSQLAQINNGVGPQYVSTRTKGGKTYKYVEASYIVELLNQLYGHIWHWEVGEATVHATGGKSKDGRDLSFVTVKGRLTVPVLNPNYDPSSPTNKDKYVWITKESFGSHALLGVDPEIQGFAYKSASTDALKKCASMLGIAKNVYMSEELFNYLQEHEEIDEWNDDTIAMYKEQYDKMMAMANENVEKLKDDITAFCQETGNYTEFGRVTPSNVIQFLEWVEKHKPTIEEDLDRLEIESQPVNTSQRQLPNW